MPYLKGDTQVDPRREFLYWTDDGELAALRYDRWKALFLEQPAHGIFGLGNAFRSIARTQAVRPARRSVRAGRDGIDRLFALADGPHLPAYACASLCRTVADQLQAISPTPEAGQLQPRSGHEADVRRQTTSHQGPVPLDARLSSLESLAVEIWGDWGKGSKCDGK